jgi:hypothetical protein
MLSPNSVNFGAIVQYPKNGNNTYDYDIYFNGGSPIYSYTNRPNEFLTSSGLQFDAYCAYHDSLIGNLSSSGFAPTWYGDADDGIKIQSVTRHDVPLTQTQIQTIYNQWKP